MRRREHKALIGDHSVARRRAELRLIAVPIGTDGRFTSPVDSQETGMTYVRRPIGVAHDATRKVSRQGCTDDRPEATNQIGENCR